MTIPKLLTPAEAAELLRVSTGRVKTLLPAIRLSERRVRYDLRDIEVLLKNSKGAQ